jgi:hypothetical protein
MNAGLLGPGVVRGRQVSRGRAFAMVNPAVMVNRGVTGSVALSRVQLGNRAETSVGRLGALPLVVWHSKRWSASTKVATQTS